MDEAEAKQILATAKYFAGLGSFTNNGYMLFLRYAVEPIFYSSSHKAVLKGYDVTCAYDLIAFLLADEGGKEAIRKLAKKALNETKCLRPIPTPEIVNRVSHLTKYLKNGFWLKVSAKEKSLHTQLRDALAHKKFEHSGPMFAKYFTN